MTKTQRIRLWLFLLAAVMFVSGGTVFYAGMQILSHEDTRAHSTDEWRDELGKQLTLSPDQDQALGLVLQEQRGKTDKVITAAEKDLEQLGMETRDRILEILEPEQKSKYQKLSGGK